MAAETTDKRLVTLEVTRTWKVEVPAESMEEALQLGMYATSGGPLTTLQSYASRILAINGEPIEALLDRMK